MMAHDGKRTVTLKGPDGKIRTAKLRRR